MFRRIATPNQRSWVPPMRSQALEYALIFACGCSPAVIAYAADSIGTVKTVNGAVHIERAAQMPQCGLKTIICRVCYVLKRVNPT